MIVGERGNQIEVDEEGDLVRVSIALSREDFECPEVSCRGGFASIALTRASVAHLVGELWAAAAED